MGAKTLRRAIKTSFPDQDYDHILSILNNWGQGPSHARSCRDYLVILHASCGDCQNLREIVDSVCKHPDLLPLYQCWQRAEKRYRTGPEYVQFFAPCVRSIATSLVPHMARCHTSLSTLVLATDLEEYASAVFVVPLLDESVFISADKECRMHGLTREGQSQFQGTFSECKDAPANVLDLYLSMR